MQKTRIDRVYFHTRKIYVRIKLYEDDIQPEIQVPPPRKKKKKNINLLSRAINEPVNL